jgi:hypothetical protein
MAALKNWSNNFLTIEVRGRVVNTPASYSKDLGLKSRPVDRLL